jgi:tetratricopeptide (TPR) repeat protein
MHEAMEEPATPEPEVAKFADVPVEQEELAWLEKALAEEPVSEEIADLEAWLGERPTEAAAPKPEAEPAAAPAPPTPLEEAPTPPHPVAEMPKPAEEELPDWLAEEEKAAPPMPAPAAAEEEELPAWLRPEAEPMDTGLDSFLAGRATTEAEPEPAAPTPAPSPVAPPPEPVAEPAAPPVMEQKPTGLLPPEYQPPVIEGAKMDYSERLGHAREMARSGEREAALSAYEALVNSGQLLDEVVADLSEAVKGPFSGVARARRMLGDALMAQGRLQEALDIYRNALDQF